MAGAEDTHTFAGRLATFQGSVQIVKRRASSAKKTKAPTTVEWPHQTPTPEQLALAGFYYNPSSANNDSVTCFMCKKSLDGWDPEDNPAVEHLNHVPLCGWAININIEQRSHESDRMEEDPMSEKMMEARRSTFRDAWPHDGKKGWKCKLEKMVAAGWCYVPLPDADDCVQCFYCSVSLDGWEPKDDPWVEHQKRAPDCQFFALIDEAAKTAKSSTKGKKARTSRASKASRLSTQSNLTMASDIGSIMDLDELPAEEEEDDINMSMVSTVSKAGGKGRAKKAPAKSTKKSTRKAKDESIMEPPAKFVADEDEVLEVEEVIEQSVNSVKPKTTRGRTTRKQEDSTLMQVEPSQLEDFTKPKRSRKRASDGTEKVSASVMAEESVLAPKPTRGRKPKADTTMVEASQIAHSMMPPEEESAPAAFATPEESIVASKPTRGRKAKVDATMVEASQLAQSLIEPAEEPIPAPKRARQAKKMQASQEPSVLMTEGPVPRSATASPAPSTLPKSKAHKATKASKLQIEETLAEEDDELSMLAQPPPVEIAPPAPTPVSSPHPIDASIVKEGEPMEIEKEEERIVEDAETHAPSSPAAQSSNAENESPASSPFQAEPTPKPVKVMTPQATPRPIFAARTPTASPSRNATTTAALTTTAPWSPINLSTIFPPSPTKASSRIEALPLQDVIARLSEEEREMSIEAWILRNASKAEEQLRGECERLIERFEGKGVEAVRALGGVVVV